MNTTRDNTIAGDGKCTLREAIANVNAAVDTTGGDCIPGSGADDTIIFSFLLPATIALAPSQGELAIAQDLIIVGPGAGSGLLAIHGRDKTRVFHITAGSTAISNLTIRNGRISSSSPISFARGGGILVENGAALDLTNCTLSKEAFAESDLPFRVDVVDWARTGEAFRAIIRRSGVPLVDQLGSGSV